MLLEETCLQVGSYWSKIDVQLLSLHQATSELYSRSEGRKKSDFDNTESSDPSDHLCFVTSHQTYI